MDVYAYNDYKKLIQHWLQTQPKKGRGIGQRLAKELRISSVLVSQILNGSRSLQLDYAHGIASFMALNSHETNYFLQLVQLENAGTESYRKHIKENIQKMQNEALEISTRVAKDVQLSEEDRAKFYSHWHYSAIRLLTDIPTFQTLDSISQALELEKPRVREILDFLVDRGLCRQVDGRYLMGVKSTHLESHSPWVYSRQVQWRQKSIHSMETKTEDNIYYTGPMVLSQKDAEWIRKRLVELIQEVTNRARKSDSESLRCLIVDWFSLV